MAETVDHGTVTLPPSEVPGYEMTPPASLGKGPLAPGPPPEYLTTYGKRVEGLIEGGEKREAEYQARTKPLMEGIGAARRDLAATPMPAQQPIGPPPDAKEFQKNAMAFASAMAVLGAVTSKFNRVPGGASLAAFGAALNGWQTGNLQAYQNATAQWKQETERTIQNNQQLIDRYKMVLENKKLNIDQMMAEMNLIATENHHQQMYDATRSGNFTLAATIADKLDEWTNGPKGLQRAAAPLMAQLEQQEAKNKLAAQQWASPQGQAELNAVNPDGTPKYNEAQKASVQQLIELFGPKGGGSGSLPPETLQQMVDRRLSGDKSVLQNIGRGAQGSKNVAAFNNALAAEMHRRGMTGADLAKVDQQYTGGSAYQRTAGTQAARIEVASNEVEQLIPQALETSRALPRGKFVPWNKLVQDWEQGTSDPAYNDFVLANFSLINAYTRAMNPQGVPRVAERLEQKAAGILNTATSPEAYEVQIRRLWKEVQASKTAVAKTGEGRSPGNINAPVPQPTAPGGTIKYDAEGNRIP